ncbi:MAG: threonylcarbamoyl-AMP synthase [Bifidobacteriaceae bacterium]|jgi:tRNA threonylcarbamoyl adenosine modification protein (Sua5/YciO/YrdC/YwlC family)|nr:threonylcarbamoyl-AMP synthase [Bifidobacteriaceae bacterium]
MTSSLTVPPDAEGLAAAAGALRAGRLVVIPTDTVYGVAADPANPEAVGRLFAAKQRPRELAIPVLVGGLEQAELLAADISPAARWLMDAFWPGGLTVVLVTNPDLAWDLGDKPGTIAVRQPDHPAALELFKATGPLAVTSANVSGHLPALTAAAARSQLGDHVAVYVDAGQAPGGTPSTVVDATDPAALPRIVREGAVARRRLEAALRYAAGHPVTQPHLIWQQAAPPASGAQPGDGQGPGA